MWKGLVDVNDHVIKCLNGEKDMDLSLEKQSYHWGIAAREDLVDEVARVSMRVLTSSPCIFL